MGIMKTTMQTCTSGDKYIFWQSMSNSGSNIETLHDTWMNKFEKIGSDSSFTNFGTMPSALLLTYGGLIDQYKYINTQRKYK